METKNIAEVENGAVTEDTLFLVVNDGEIRKTIKLIPAITDPDNNPLSVTNAIIPVMEPGKINNKTGDLTNDIGNSRTKDFIKIERETAYRFQNQLGVKICVTGYDASKNFVKSWNDVYSYKYLSSGNTFTFYSSDIEYIKFSTSETDDLTNVYEIVKVSEQSNKKMEFKKMFFPHFYLEEHEFDPGFYEILLQALSGEYNIFTVKAPKQAPKEATVTLMLKNDDLHQFVDLSCMKYGDSERGTMEIAMQSRGATLLPDFAVTFSDGTTAGVSKRVKKFVIDPDAVPIRMTAVGLEVRKNNNFDNTPAADELVTVNLAELKERVDKIYMALLANGTITE